MSADHLVQQLIDELLDSHATPEEVCAAHPELLTEVRDRWRKVRYLRDELDALFPDDGHKPVPVVSHNGVSLPQVPGYAVEAVLGCGGMGVVFQARHLRLNRLVALKMMLSGSYAGSLERNRFQREAEAVAGLRHPNVVQVYDVGDVDGTPYFTMEFVEDGSLAQKLTGNPLPAGRAAELLATLAAAVQAAHATGIVHRDLKPANVLLTADGTPKVSDFGLARRLCDSDGLTQTGLVVGTPSYMAPEQAQGKAVMVGPSADIYALGAILYELLTGRPPFRGETAAETVQQLLDQDPVPPSRLNARVPRDLETICLKCIQKAPRLRYATAGELADDLQRFRDGRPILARPLGLPGRLWRWGRRNPAGATVLVLAGLAVGGFVWAERRQAERREDMVRQEERERIAVDGALNQAASLQEQGRWPEARAVLDGATGLLSDAAAPDLHERLNTALADMNTTAELEDIRLRVSEGRASGEPFSLTADRLYSEVFRNYGIVPTVEGSVEAATIVHQSAIRETLLAFLHDWLHAAPAAKRVEIREVLNRADNNKWRRAFRDAIAAQDSSILKELAAAPEALNQPPVVLSSLAAPLAGGHGGEARKLLRVAQRRHPGDFWINYQLGDLLLRNHPAEAAGYFRAATAIRATSGQAHTMLGRALRDAGDSDGAITAFRNAIRLNPNRVGGRDLARVLAPRGELKEALIAWEKALELDPPDHDPWYGYAQLCLFLGQTEAYQKARRALLDRFADCPTDWFAAERTSLACLLLPAHGEELNRIVTLSERAIALGPKPTQADHAYLLFVKGFSKYRQGLPVEAIPLLRDATLKLPNRVGPRLVLAMAQYQSGATREARTTLAAAVQGYGWDEVQADHPTAWVSHILRREAEVLILPNLPAFLAGMYQPQEDERLALLGVCESRRLDGHAARLFADAFAAEPNLADDSTIDCLYRAGREEQLTDRLRVLAADCQYRAARAAARAGCGSDESGDPQRKRLREQARSWLRADLKVWVRTLDSGSGVARELAGKMLVRWQSDPDLAGLREPTALDRLDAVEREECLALWDLIDHVLGRAARQRNTAQKRADAERTARTSLLKQGKFEEAAAVWRNALDANPLDHDDWYGYAELCLFLGREEEYVRARRELLVRFGGTVHPFEAERTARTCLLRPLSGYDLQRAGALADFCAGYDRTQLEWAHPYFQFVLGLAEFRRGEYDRAISIMKSDASKALGPAPLLVLAMALHQNGKAEDARHALAQAILSHDWGENHVLDQAAWIYKALRWEAERMIASAPTKLP